MPILRLLRTLVVLLFTLAMSCSLISFRALANHLTVHVEDGSDDGGEDGDPGTGNGTCANVGVEYPDNPFRGWPISGGSWPYVTAYYCDSYYLQNFGYAHFGIDLGYTLGTPAIATANATVVRAQTGHASMGNNVKVCTDNGWCATYMHFSQISVTLDQSVTPGTVLGLVGTTGNSTGYHLHYELHAPTGMTIDPAPTFP